MQSYLVMNTPITSVSANKKEAHKWLSGCLVITLILILTLISPTKSFADKNLELLDFKNQYSCVDDSDCKFRRWVNSYPYPECQNGSCSCTNDMCYHYTTIASGNWFYYCGECGEIGSTCPTHDSCKHPGVCTGNFCSCRNGNLVMDVCVQFDSLTNFKETLILIGILFAILFVNRLFLWRKALKRLACLVVSCGRHDFDDDETVVGHNPEGAEKSAAYTISSREFNASSDDPDLAWALELSAQMADDSEMGDSNGLQAESLPRTRGLIRRNGIIRREYRQRSSVHEEGSFSSHSSTRSNVSGRSITDSSTLPSTPSSCSSTPLGTLRRETLNDEIQGNKRRGYYCLRHQPENSEEIVMTRILTQKRLSSASFDSIPSADVVRQADSFLTRVRIGTFSTGTQTDSFSTGVQADSFPTGARPKQTNNRYKLLDKVINKVDNAVATTSCTDSNSSDFSDDGSLTYSSARSNLSRDSCVSCKSNFSSEDLNIIRNNSASSSDSGKTDRGTETDPFEIISQHREVLKDYQNSIKIESSDGTGTWAKL